MPMFECKKCHEEWIGTAQQSAMACPNCGTVTNAFGAGGSGGDAGGRGGGLFIGRMTQEDLEKRLGIAPDPPKSSGGGIGCLIVIAIIIAILYFAR